MSSPSPFDAVRRDVQAFRAAGDLDSARGLLAEALVAARPAYGEDHPEILGLAHQLGRLHREAGDPAGARRVLEEAIAAGERRHGHADALMLGLSFDLGTVAEELGNRHEASRNFGRVARFGPATLGADHWAVSAARAYLGDDAPAPQGEPPAAPAPPAPAHPPAPAPPPPPAPAPTPPNLPPPAAARPAGRAQVSPAAPARPATPPGQPGTPPPVPAVPPGVESLDTPYPDPTAGRLPPYPPLEPQPATPAPAARPAGGRGRAPVVVAAAAAVVAAVSATVTAVMVLRDDPTPPPPPTAPTAGPVVDGEPPTGVRVRDDGTAITVTWEDPSPGTVPFIVAGGRAGQQLRAMATINPGETSHTVNGLNPRLNYCFTVLAVYSTERYATSGQVCTDRSGSTPD
ncbi:tetratricopeptide repeat protein [Polymorphospora sp. NPDC051019]|uniref:tetratricopeptide repeat protein n=1 Tax=Polymorphospora sp. NPDC051019 TaxID=3155725 RepID=UPI00344340E5